MCPAGTVIVGGGWDGETAPPVAATVAFNKPLGSNAWEVILADNSFGNVGFTQTFNAVATCVGGGIQPMLAQGLTQSERDQLAHDIAAVTARAK
jgi:hypothetical protein